jgi:hypothetical protein
MQKILRSEEDGSTLHIYIQRQHNETTKHRKRGDAEEGKCQYDGRGELVQGTL